MTIKQITQEEHKQLLNQFLNSDSQLYIYGQKEFGFIIDDIRIDVTINEVTTKKVLIRKMS